MVTGKNSFYPIEECLDICKEYNQAEAIMLLSKKLGKYFDSVCTGIQILRERIDYRKVVVELYYCREIEIPTRFVMPKSKRIEAMEREEKI